MEPENNGGRKMPEVLKKIATAGKWVVVIALGIMLGNALIEPRGEEIAEEEVALTDYEGCNVAGVELHGTILTYISDHAEGDTEFDYDATASEDVGWLIENANADENVKAILLEVDSYGGWPVAGEEIATAVKESSKPVVGLIRSAGVSAAYWAVSGADKIFASKNSDVGSIGVTMSYLSEVELNKKEGYTFEQLSVGKYKDAGSVDKPLTGEEKELFLRDLNIIHENFITAVSENRSLALEVVRAFADGSTVLGERAKELGLVDEIGGFPEVKKHLAELVGEEAAICW